MQFDIRLWQNVVKTTAGQTQLGHTLTQVTFKIVKNKTISSAELPSSVWLGPVQLGPNSQSCIPVAGNSFKIISPMRELNMHVITMINSDLQIHRWAV